MAGTLSATVTAAIPAVPRNADFTAGGAFTISSVTPVIAMSAALSGAGALTAPGFQRFASSPALAGAGALTATDSQKYAPAAALAGTGALTATAVAIIPIAVIGTPTAANATVLTLPAHAVGDLIIIAAYRASNTVATKPAASGTVPAWVDIDAPTGTNTNSLRTAYFKATATNHTSGTWASATGMTAIVLRNQNPASPLGGHGVGTGSAGGAGSIAPAVTMTKTDGTSFLLHIHFHPSATNFTTVPTGYTRLFASTAANMCMNRKTATTSDGAIAQTDDNAIATSYAAASIELLT